MSEQDHDRLEEFFRKASVRPEVPFNEDDWKKLEARLDAAGLSGVSGAKKTGGKLTTTIATGVVLLFVAALWVGSDYGSEDLTATKANTRLNQENEIAAAETDSRLEPGENKTGDLSAVPLPEEAQKAETSTIDKIGNAQRSTATQKSVAAIPSDGKLETTFRVEAESRDRVRTENASTERRSDPATDQPTWTPTLRNGKVFSELIVMSPANAEKIKQRANVDLPGAEEGDTGEADAIVTEEDASVEQVVTPRLSLLLSFAPDFSSTSNQYSAPGKAYGAVVHYHFLKKWSLSAGVVKNNKKYTGDGEDYQPPKGYWKYYTNGVVPHSIDGACTVLEFPVMLQYTIADNGKHRWLAGAGTSSYVMLDESYRYYFEQPNPGANEEWVSKNTSRFYLNMLNVTIGYERQVLPGLMVGIEPYVKIPLEAIGWSNIRLFSTGASFTLRYRILGKKNTLLPFYSRGPD